jgi:endonuclease/exonuclease/phosphatase (EEP) superfamily protein YafD
MPAISRTIALYALALLTACASEPVTIPVESGVVHAGVPVQTEPEACMAQLGADNSELYKQLDSTDIRLVNWNIQKGGDPEWVSDLNRITVEPDLMTLQEAALNTDAWSDVGAKHYRSFAPGYLTRHSLTGVMTISSAEPVTQCNLTSVEPWLRSPKATIITEYGLTGTDLTLLVVNLHAVNFTFGASDFREQIQQMQTVVSAHEGPMLLSGDFNTWGWRRARILQEMTDGLDLEMLDYEVDHRKRFFGKVLDRIYTRGLTVMESTTQRVDSSDHNPMSVRMRL